MANPLQVASKSKLVTEKARLIFSDILGQYQQGVIKTELELQYKVYMALETFFNDFGKPAMKYRPAWGPPISADYNDTMSEVYNDLTTLFTECKAMTSALNESFSQVEFERLQLTGQIGDIQDAVKAIDLKLSQKRDEIIFRESFIDKTLLDAEMVEGTIAEVNTKEGVLSLSKIEAEEFRDGARITILSGNGFPGNTHQVRAVSGTYKFFGEDNLHLDLSAIMDGNSDTWFEYELFYADKATKAAAGGYGFDYKEGVSWVQDNLSPLNLYIEIELPTAKNINWLSLSPFLPADKGANPTAVRSIIIHDGKGSANEITNGYQLLRDDEVFIFPRQRCKRVRIKLQQDTAYETDVGHIFFKELESSAVNYIAKDKEQPGRRINGPKPSAENLGFKFDAKHRKLNQPIATYGDPVQGENMIKANLFQPPAVTGQVQAGLEGIVARRYAICLRDVNISSYRFAATSTYISKNFETLAPIKEVSLDVGTMVPAQFGEGEWIAYFISVDDGKTWQQLHRRGTSKANVKTSYIINGNVPLEARYDDIGYVDTATPVTAVRLKIELKRPPEMKDSDYYTPVVQEYKLRCLTAKE